MGTSPMESNQKSRKRTALNATFDSNITSPITSINLPTSGGKGNKKFTNHTLLDSSANISILDQSANSIKSGLRFASQPRAGRIRITSNSPRQQNSLFNDSLFSQTKKDSLLN